MRYVVWSRNGFEVLAVDVGIEPCRNFIKSYIVVDHESKLFVVIEPGPRAGLDRLREVVEELLGKGYTFSAIIPTHIHLDHYSAAPTLAKMFNVVTYLHPRGVKHAVDPKKLCEASVQVLGDEAYALGLPEPLPEELARATNDGEELRFGRIVVRIVHTPGHAPHHQAVVVNRMLFSGDACGGYHAIADAVFPTSPPGLRLDAYVESIKKLMNLDLELWLPTHVDWTKPSMIVEHLQQIARWTRVVLEAFDRGETIDVGRLRDVDPNVEKIFASEALCTQRARISIEKSLEAVKMEVERLLKEGGRNIVEKIAESSEQSIQRF